MHKRTRSAEFQNLCFYIRHAIHASGWTQSNNTSFTLIKRMTLITRKIHTGTSDIVTTLRTVTHLYFGHRAFLFLRRRGEKRGTGLVVIPCGTDSTSRTKRASFVGRERTGGNCALCTLLCGSLHLSLPVNSLAHPRAPHLLKHVLCTRPRPYTLLPMHVPHTHRRTPRFSAGTLWRWWPVPKVIWCFVELICLALITYFYVCGTIMIDSLTEDSWENDKCFQWSSREDSSLLS